MGKIYQPPTLIQYGHIADHTFTNPSGTLRGLWGPCTSTTSERPSVTIPTTRALRVADGMTIIGPRSVAHNAAPRGRARLTFPA